MKKTAIALIITIASFASFGGPSVGYQTATNIAGRVTSNVVTKAYVEGLGIEAGIGEDRAREIVDSSFEGGTNKVNDAIKNARSVTDLSVYKVTEFEYVSGLPSGFTVFDPPVWEISYWVCGVEDSDGNTIWVFDNISPEFATELHLDKSFDWSPVGFTLVYKAAGTAVDPSNRLATMADLNANSLRTMLVDANTNTTADCECISSNICKLASPAITNAVINIRDRFYDEELDVTWKRTVNGGRIFYDIEAIGDSTED